MHRFSGTLRAMIRTSALVSNREAANAFISYLAYVVGGLLLSVTAIIPVMSGTARAAADSPMIFLATVVMFDYFNIQTFLNRTTLTDRSVVGLFPLSNTRSAAFRFVLMLLDKRMLFYVIPALVLVVMLSARGEPMQAAAIIMLYASFYLVISEVMFGILPFFRSLARRFGVRTATQMAALPLLLLVFVPGIFRMKYEAALRIPVVSEFVRGSNYILASNFTAAAVQTAGLLAIALVLGALLLMLASLSARIHLSPVVAPAGNASVEPGRAAARRHSPVVVQSAEKSKAVGESETRSVNVGARPMRRLVFMDWQIRQREEKAFYVLLVVPFVAVILAQAMVHGLHRPIASAILPIFFVTQMIGIPLIERGFTLRGLRLKHVSILPLDPVRFVRAKLASSWFLIALANLFVTVLVAFRWGITYYQGIQGVIYSFFIAFILILTQGVLIIMFNAISRHALISVLIAIVIEALATFVYMLIMLFNFALGVLVVALFFSITYFGLLPRLGRMVSEEFQVLLEESK